MRPASTGSIPEERAVDRDPRGAGASDVGIRRASLVSLVVHGLVGWAACGALMGGLMAVGPISTALVVHAIGAPVIFTALTAHLFVRHGARPPLVVAAFFTALVVTLDALVVAWLIQGSFEMFSSVLGTWIPFGLIFVSVFVTGSLLRRAHA